VYYYNKIDNEPRLKFKSLFYLTFDVYQILTLIGIRSKIFLTGIRESFVLK